MIPEMMSIKNTCYLYVFGLLKEIENFFLTLLQCELFLKKILITYVIKITSQDPKCFKLCLPPHCSVPRVTLLSFPYFRRALFILSVEKVSWSEGCGRVRVPTPHMGGGAQRLGALIPKAARGRLEPGLGGQTPFSPAPAHLPAWPQFQESPGGPAGQLQEPRSPWPRPPGEGGGPCTGRGQHVHRTPPLRVHGAPRAPSQAGPARPRGQPL